MVHEEMKSNDIAILETLAVSNADPSLVSSEIVNHLREQVKIISDLYGQYQHSLSVPEQDWIQNAISYTKHILKAFDTRVEEQNNQRKSHRRLASLNVLTRNRQLQPQVAAWNSQFLIATQNLNGAMSMLSRCAHCDAPPNQNFTIADGHDDLPNQPGTELSKFLNRRRAVRTPASAADFQRAVRLKSDVENTIVELRTTNSLLHSSCEAACIGSSRTVFGSNELPLTLVGTVERWRQNAEDALKAAMRRYFEQEQHISKGDLADGASVGDTTLCESATLQDRTESLETSIDRQQTAFVIQDISTVDSRGLTSPPSLAPRSPPDVSTYQTPRQTPSRQSGSSDASSLLRHSCLISPSATNPAVPSDQSQRSVISPIPTSPTYQMAATSQYNSHVQDTQHYHHPEPSLISASTLLSTINTSQRPSPHSPFLTAHSDAQTSTVSLVSFTAQDLSPVSRTARLSPAVSARKLNPQPVLGEMQIEPCLSSPKQTKSRGRAWLERQAGSDG